MEDVKFKFQHQSLQVRQRLMRVLPFLVFCHKEKMELLVGHFRPVLDFERFDAEHSAEDTAKMESFCVFCDGIERNENGNQLKDMIIRANIVKVGIGEESHALLNCFKRMEQTTKSSHQKVISFVGHWCGKVRGLN